MPMLWVMFLLSGSAFGSSPANSLQVDPQNVEELRVEFEKKLPDALAQLIAESRGKDNQPTLERGIKLLAPAVPPATNKLAKSTFINMEVTGNNSWSVETEFAARIAPRSLVPPLLSQ